MHRGYDPWQVVISPATKPAAKIEVAVFTLVRLTGPRKNEKLRLEQARVRLGRAKGNHVRFDREKERVVSNYHAEIRGEDGGFVLYDLQSTHGTYVNNERISRRRLQEADIIGLAQQMGGPSLRFSQRATERLLPNLASRDEPELPPGPTGGAPQTPSLSGGKASTRILQAEAAEGGPEDLAPGGAEGTPGEEARWYEPEIPVPDAVLDTGAPAGGAEDPTSWLQGRNGSPTGHDPGMGTGTNGAPPSPPTSDGTAAAASDDDESTSFYPPPPPVSKPGDTLSSKVDRAIAQGRHALGSARARMLPLLGRLKPRRGAPPVPEPGALIDPTAGSISIGTRVGSGARKAAQVARNVSRKLVSGVSRKRKAPATPAEPGADTRARRTRKKKAPRRADPLPAQPLPRRSKPFVLEEAIKEPPRADWIWMQKHRWFLRFLLVGIALSWWYQERISNWFLQFSAGPVPVIQGRSPEEGLAASPGSENTEFVELTRELYEQTLSMKPMRRSDGNRDLRALRAVLWKAGEKSALVPVDFLEDISGVIDEVREERDFRIVYARSMRHRPYLVRILREHHLPELMSFIPWIESKYLPDFQDNRSGKAGLWGLDVETARRHGLTVDNQRDDRLDWKLSTRAACSYLVELVGELRGLSFTLAVTAYPGGPLAVRRMLAQRKAWKQDEINLRYFYREGYIPSDMFDYLARVLAVASVSESPEAYHLPPLEDE